MWLKLITSLVTVFLLLGCSSGQEEVPLGFLVLHSGSYEGRTLGVKGRVRGLEEPEHYWLEDKHYNRVGLTPGSAVQDYLDQQVRVVGRFQASSDHGRQLHVRAIERLESPP